MQQSHIYAVQSQLITRARGSRAIVHAEAEADSKAEAEATRLTCGTALLYCAFANKWRVVLKSISTPTFSRR
jgi:hypothetical protein